MYISWKASIRMMTSSHGNAFRVTGNLWGESTVNRWFALLTKDRWRGVWCFVRCTSEKKRGTNNEVVLYCAIIIMCQCTGLKISVLFSTRNDYFWYNGQYACRSSLSLRRPPVSDALVGVHCHSCKGQTRSTHGSRRWPKGEQNILFECCGTGLLGYGAVLGHPTFLLDSRIANVGGTCMHRILARHEQHSEIIMGMGSANDRRRYKVTSSVIGWAHTHDDIWTLRNQSVTCYGSSFVTHGKQSHDDAGAGGKQIGSTEMHHHGDWTQFSLMQSSLQWRLNERDGVSNYRRIVCLFNRLFWRTSKKTPKLRVSSFARGIHRWAMDSSHKGLYR